MNLILSYIMIRNDAEIDFARPKYFGNHVEVPREGPNRGNKSRINLESLLVPISSLSEYYNFDTCSLGMIFEVV